MMTIGKPVCRRTACLLVSVLWFIGCGEPTRSGPSDEDADLDQDQHLDSTFPGPVSPGSCVITAEELDSTQDQAEPFTCEISIHTGRGCDDLARCLCEYARGLHPDSEVFDLAACIEWLVVPRGMITLSDYCPWSGSSGEALSIGDLVNEQLPQSWIDLPFPPDTALQASEPCDEVAAYSLWGEEPAWFFSLFEQNATVPEPSHRIEDYPIESYPLLMLDHVVEFTAFEALAVLTAEGKSCLAERFEGGEPTDLLGRSFLMHSATTPLEVGTIVSHVMSSWRPGPVLLIEDFAEADYGELRFFDQYPSDDPMDFSIFFLGHFAAVGKLTDAACISSCGCPGERACREHTCTELPSGCQSDEDCCLGRCGVDHRCH
ncbi:MAG: hypothetical protein JW797_08940 [Bradymonadales bacterium]|nr:hypothetical protein [Bradymonadales bacterium]